jgi:hypothetical protein
MWNLLFFHVVSLLCFSGIYNNKIVYPGGFQHFNYIYTSTALSQKPEHFLFGDILFPADNYKKMVNPIAKETFSWHEI